LSLSAAVLNALVEAGVTREQLVAAMHADIAVRDAEEAAKLEAKRQGNRDRQQRKRERDSNAKSRVTPVTARDSRDKGSNDIDILTSKPPPVISDEITPPSENPVLKPEHVVEAWNEMAARTGLPAIRKLTPDRVKALDRRIKENTIQDFTEAIDAIERSPFLRGDSKRGWRADFDFLLSPTKFNRLLEGTYGE
jgi:hypothetical protein